MKNIAQLSWKLKDYLSSNEEPPECVLNGKTEGEIMEQEDIEKWAVENIRFLSVFKDEYPEKFNDQLVYFLADLDYLCKIGKITETQKKKLGKSENFEFGKEK